MQELIEINQAKEWKYFHQVPHLVYAGNPQYIHHLEKDVQDVFNPAINKRFDHGEARCFVLLDKGKAVGRIAVFIDHEHNQTQPYPVGGLGFFECVNRKEYAVELFSTAEKILREKGMKAIDGPINFGERDRFWGLLVKGFDRPPLYQENYHLPHYQTWFEEEGFLPYEQVLTFRGATKNVPLKRLGAIAQRAKKRAAIRIRPFKYKERADFANDFATVYNASFQHFPHFHPVSQAQVVKLVEQSKTIIDPQMICLAYFEEKPAGFIFLYPDINPLLRSIKGKLNLRTIPIFLLKNKLQKSYNLKGLGFGVHPDYHLKGIFAVLVDHLGSPQVLRHYTQIYLAGIRTQNHEIRSMYKKLQVEIDRVHVHYRKMLDESIAFEPHEFLAV